MLRDAAAEAAAASLDVQVFTSLAAAEPAWRRLEAEAVLSPYQRFDWVAAVEAARGRSRGRLAVAVIHRDRAPVAVLPLDITRRWGLALATPLASDIGNVGWVATTPEFAPQLKPELVRALLADAGRAAGGLDALLLYAQPRRWLGLDNPLLAFPHQPAPDSFYYSAISGEEGFGRINAKRARNISRGRRRLLEMFGPVRLEAAADPETIDRVHAAFLAQRGKRFEQMGVRNVFADPWFVRFFRDTAIASLGEARPTLRFHALYAGSEIVATSCGTYAGTHYSQYINSTVDGPAAKYSLMGLLMFDLVQELSQDGINSLDMGLGDFDYKTDWTDPVEVFDAVIPVSTLGRLAAPALRQGRALKRAIKQNDALFNRLKRLRALVLRSEKHDPDPTNT